MRIVFAALCCLPLWLCASATVQQAPTQQVPTQQTPAQQAPAQQAIPPQAATRSDVKEQAQAVDRTLSGTITDMDGALVPGAHVTLSSGNQQRSTVTGSDGRFSFSGVAAGSFLVTVTASGLEATSQIGTLNSDESLEMPPIALYAAASDDVIVSGLSEQEIAQEQVKQEEQQRLGGLVPNFYVTYDWKAAPLTTRQKFKLAARSIVDPATFIIVGGFAGLEQATNEFSGYGQGAAGYAKRYTAGFADTSIGAMLGGALLPSIFHQDPRYFYKGTGSVHSRIWYSLSTAVIARGDNGKWQPAYAGILGDFGSGAISNLYYPAVNRDGATLTIENGFIAVASTGLGNLLQEFVLKKISSGLKGHAAAQP